MSVNPQMRNPPGQAAGFNETQTNGRGLQGDNNTNSRLSAKTDRRLSVDPLGLLLSRLDNVRQYGTGYRADCPAGHKSRGTLSVTVGDAGQALMHCFSGCGAAEVVARLGVSFGDLFPERSRDMSPQGRHRAREAFKVTGWTAALGVLGREATVVEIAAHDLADGKMLAEADHARLMTACQRIQSAREVLT